MNVSLFGFLSVSVSGIWKWNTFWFIFVLDIPLSMGMRDMSQVFRFLLFVFNNFLSSKGGVLVFALLFGFSWLFPRREGMQGINASDRRISVASKVQNQRISFFAMGSRRSR